VTIGTDCIDSCKTNLSLYIQVEIIAGWCFSISVKYIVNVYISAKTFYSFLQTNTKKTQPSNQAAEYDYKVDQYEDIVQVGHTKYVDRFTTM
jgi:hypothetical protein